MALVRIPYFGLIFRPFVKQEISRECLLGLLGKINPERNFDGELMVCRAHGGCSTGPPTQQGRKRCAEARYQHGWETRKARELRAKKFHEMKTLFSLIED